MSPENSATGDRGPVMGATLAGALAVLAFALLGIAWIVLEIAQVGAGLTDGDDPSVALAFLRANPDAYAGSGLVLLLMAVTLTVAALAVSDVLEPRADRLALRTVTVLALFSAAAFLLFGVLRLSTGPLLYIDGLQPAWGEGAYLIIVMAGIHGLGQAGILTLCLWAVGISLIGIRTKAIPTAVCVLGVLPFIRLVSLFGPLGILPEDLPDGLWFVFLLAIPGAMIWCLALGLSLLRRPAMATAPTVALDHS
jgi:hypothetical protein